MSVAAAWCGDGGDELLCVDLESATTATTADDRGAGRPEARTLTAAWHECADLLRTRRPRPHRTAVLLARYVLVRYPGCLLSVVARSEGGSVVGVRLPASGRIVVLVVTGGGQGRRSGRAAGPRPVC
ncbi:hypothetical protein [Streptomyces sp. NPDC090025]|uniref:hypothetical protein n=1 Tax=Streptomyces sp. NPDC090025 TaxID=3365922 RepID=UPI003838C149